MNEPDPKTFPIQFTLGEADLGHVRGFGFQIKQDGIIYRNAMGFRQDAKAADLVRELRIAADKLEQWIQSFEPHRETP